MFLLNFAGTTRGKQGQQRPYKLMAQDKDRSPLQFTGTAVLRAYESEQQFLIFYTEMLTIETAVSNANL